MSSQGVVNLLKGSGWGWGAVEGKQEDVSYLIGETGKGTLKGGREISKEEGKIGMPEKSLKEFNNLPLKNYNTHNFV